MEMELNVTGHKVTAYYSEKEINKVLLPLLEKLADIRRKKGSRLIVYLAAPPGTGKTTLSLFLEKLYAERGFPYTFQSVSMDGFHHRQNYLRTHSIERNGKKVLLSMVKGSPESFDLSTLKEKLESLLKDRVAEWPIYDRNLHDVSEETLSVSADIVLVEGNYLLMNEEGWRELRALCDYSVFIEASETDVRERLIERKMRGGISRSEAETFYQNSDRKNIFRIMEHQLEPDLKLTLTECKELAILNG